MGSCRGIEKYDYFKPKIGNTVEPTSEDYNSSYKIMNKKTVMLKDKRICQNYCLFTITIERVTTPTTKP